MFGCGCNQLSIYLIYNLFAAVGVGGNVMGKAPPYSAMSQQTMHYPTAPTVQPMYSQPQQQQYQITSASTSSTVTQQ